MYIVYRFSSDIIMRKTFSRLEKTSRFMCGCGLRICELFLFRNKKIVTPKPDGANELVHGLVARTIQVSFGSFDKQRPAASAFTRIIKFHLIHMMNTKTGKTAKKPIERKTQLSRTVLKANKTFIWLRLEQK